MFFPSLVCVVKKKPSEINSGGYGNRPLQINRTTFKIPTMCLKTLLYTYYVSGAMLDTFYVFLYLIRQLLKVDNSQRKKPRLRMGGIVNTLRDTQKQVCLVPWLLPHREAPVLWSLWWTGICIPLIHGALLLIHRGRGEVERARHSSCLPATGLDSGSVTSGPVARASYPLGPQFS